MTDINRVVLIGRLTRDVELKATNSGQSVCRFTLANNYRKKSGDGYTDAVNFIDCVAWGKTAEAIHKFVAKGQRLLVEGCLRWSSWEHEGKKHSKTEILVESFNFIERKEGAPASDPSPAAFDEHAMDDAPF